MKKRYLALIGILTFLTFAVVLAPATLLRHILPAANDYGIRVGPLAGTLWNGTASSIVYQQHRLDNVQWQVLPSSLLLGRLALTVDASYLQHPLTTRAAVGLNSKLYLADTRLRLPAGMLVEYGLVPIGELEGDIEVDLQHLELAQQAVPLARGVVSWQQAAVTIAETARLGDIDIELDGVDDGQLVASLRNKGGDIRLGGNARVDESGEYTVELTLVAGKTASNNVKNSLTMFAKPQADGSYIVNNTGNIFDMLN